MGNLAFFFFPFFFLLEAVENIYFNFHSWHISSATWNVCAIEHHKLPWDGSPSGRIWASKYSQNQRAASWSLPCHPSQDLCQAFRTLFQTWSLFFLVKLQGKTEAFQFQRFCSGCSDFHASRSLYSESDRVWWALTETQRDFSWTNLLKKVLAIGTSYCIILNFFFFFKKWTNFKS